ncbi:MAG TPA: hypothetical protein VFU37_17510 [Pyrinomonadaceae bacterium]|nr:hypothetical protein [Pyrinomonadaceae bacterium]
MKTRFLLKQVLPAAFVFLSAAIFTFAQDLPGNKQNARPEPATATRAPNATSVDPVKYSYEFNQPKFYIRHIVLQHDATGRGTITFERLNEDVPVVEPLELSPAALARISSLWEALKFLDSDTNYQSSQQFAHLGTMKIGMERGDRKRFAEFNWTHNDSAAALVSEYRRASDQAILVFDISVARENQPLNAPKLMEVLESLLKRDGLSDPKQLVPLLKDISSDDHVPLIARNHALRLIKQIEK